MTREEVQKILDDLKKGPLGRRSDAQWDSAYRLKELSTHNNPMKRPEIAKKISDIHKGKVLSQQHKDKISKTKKEIGAFKGVNNYWAGSHRTGSNAPNYGKGNKYIEVSTGYIGTPLEVMNKFNITKDTYIYNSVRRDKPISSGPFQGLHFQVYNEKEA